MTAPSIPMDNHISKIHPTVWRIGFMMFLLNFGFIMGYSYITIYMDSLGVAFAWIGLAEGLAEG